MTLLDEGGVQVPPLLAKAIGLNEAIFLKQVHYWLGNSGKTVEGQEGLWIYNTAEEWQEQFPFWSIPTIKRIIKSLRDSGLLLVGRFNKLGNDRTNWYSIDYEVFENRTNPSYQIDTMTSYQNDTSIVSDCTNPSYQIDTMTSYQNEPMLPKTTQILTNQKEKTPVTVAVPPPKKPPKPKDKPPIKPKVSTPHQAMVDAYISVLGYTPQNMGKEAKSAKWLVENHFTPEQVVACYRHLKQDKFWSQKFVSLQKVAEQISEFARTAETPKSTRLTLTPTGAREIA